MSTTVGIDASNIRAGGGLTHLQELLSALEPEAHGVDQVTVWCGGETAGRLPVRDWLQVEHVPELDGGFVKRAMWRRRRLDGLLRESSDVLFAPGGVYLGSFRPFVTMSQNLLPFDPPERARFGLTKTRLRYHLLERLQTKTFRRAAGVVFMTKTARRMALSRTGTLSGETAVIPHGLAPRFRRDRRPSRSLEEATAEAPLRVLYVSIVNLYKHQWHVAEAVAQLREEGIPVELDLIGPAYAPALRRLERALDRVDPARAFVHYHGPVPYEELDRHYCEADVFVFASSCETFGIIVLEAMAAGLPVACARRSALPDVVGNAGVYFDPEDPSDIARCLKKLLEDQGLRDDLSRRSHECVAAFSWDRCARDTFDFIARTATGAGRHAATGTEQEVL